MSQSIENQVIITLLGRLVFGHDKILEIVTRGKKNPKKYIQGYNACDGTKNISEIAKVIGVKQPTLTPIIKLWEIEGIIYNVGTDSRPLFKKLFSL
ncbi:MAG: hypothetical protein CVT49_16260 [candidate division Zixibacteria bacterium HGW-Zixibacteria-1]|nr:MAG: hypothetical protein CVT49_16260 [candidate division Zixibacteria bacterium HGW-Zixibacteria-1]